MTVRFWTHGWDLFSPAQGLIFHLWERDYRRVYAEDMKDRVPGVLRGKTKGGRVTKRRYLHVGENVSFVYPEIYCGRCIFFICISDSQRIESCHGTSEGIEHIIWKQCILSNAISLMHWMRIVAQTAILDFFYISTSTCPCWLSSCGSRLVDVPPQNLEAWTWEKSAFSTRQNHKPVMLQVKLCFVSG